MILDFLDLFGTVVSLGWAIRIVLGVWVPAPAPYVYISVVWAGFAWFDVLALVVIGGTMVAHLVSRLKK